MLSSGLQVVLFAALVLPSCKDKDKDKGSDETDTVEPTSPTEPGVQTPADAQPKRTWHGDYVLRSGSLYRVLEDGKMESILPHDGATYCETDSRSQSIWLLGSSGLSVHDLESQKTELVVAASPGEIGAFEVRFGLDQGKIGNADGLRDDVALILVATKHIALKSEIICEGARESFCYVDTSSDDPDLWQLRPIPTQTKARYDALKLSETQLLLALAQRRLGRPEIEEEGEPEDEAVPDSNPNGRQVAPGVEPAQSLACGKIHEYVATAPSASTQ